VIRASPRDGRRATLGRVAGAGGGMVVGTPAARGHVALVGAEHARLTQTGEVEAWEEGGGRLPRDERAVPARLLAAQTGGGPGECGRCGCRGVGRPGGIGAGSDDGCRASAGRDRGTDPARPSPYRPGGHGAGPGGAERRDQPAGPVRVDGARARGAPAGLPPATPTPKIAEQCSSPGRRRASTSPTSSQVEASPRASTRPPSPTAAGSCRFPRRTLSRLRPKSQPAEPLKLGAD